MVARTHISKISAERFEEAVRTTLARMSKAGVPFSVNEIIRASIYGDGSRVGETTLYAKASNGAYVHATLLRELKAAASRSRRKRVRTPLASAAKPQGPGLDQQLERTPTLERQLLEQESRLSELEGAVVALGLQTALQRQDLYVALTVLNRLTHSKVLPVFAALQEVKQGLAPEVIQAGNAKAQEIEEQCRNAILAI